MAFARTGKDCSKESIDLITKNVIDEYSDLPIDSIIQALKNGGRGKYGRTYLLSVQEVCIWIDSYLKDFPEDDIDNDRYDYFRKNNEYYLNIRRCSKGRIDFEDDRFIQINTDQLGARKKSW